MFEVPDESPAISAVEGEYDRGWTDWSRAVRQERIDVLSAYVTWVNGNPARRGQWADDLWRGIPRPVPVLAAPVAPEGWYPDPSEAHLFRWWNGEAWADATTKDQAAPAPDEQVPGEQPEKALEHGS